MDREPDSLRRCYLSALDDARRRLGGPVQRTQQYLHLDRLQRHAHHSECDQRHSRPLPRAPCSDGPRARYDTILHVYSTKVVAVSSSTVLYVYL